MVDSGIVASIQTSSHRGQKSQTCTWLHGHPMDVLSIPKSADKANENKEPKFKKILLKKCMSAKTSL